MSSLKKFCIATYLNKLGWKNRVNPLCLFLCRKESVSVVKSYTYDDGCESCGTDTFMREPFVVMFSSKYTGMLYKKVVVFEVFFLFTNNFHAKVLKP